jgi:hypothetical protein
MRGSTLSGEGEGLHLGQNVLIQAARLRATHGGVRPCRRPYTTPSRIDLAQMSRRSTYPRCHIPVRPKGWYRSKRRRSSDRGGKVIVRCVVGSVVNFDLSGRNLRDRFLLWAYCSRAHRGEDGKRVPFQVLFFGSGYGQPRTAIMKGGKVENPD